jgi:phosphatidylinositol dimannoside acyltransferase
VRAFLTYALYRFLGAVTGPLPSPAGYWLARRVGALLYRFSPRLRAVFTHNIRHVLGPDADEERLEALVRQAFVNVAKGHHDLFRVNRLSIEQIRERVEIEGMSHLTEALRLGRGAVVVTAHVGNVDIVGQVPLAYGIPITGAAMHIEPERLFRYTLRLRQSHGLRLLPSNGPMLGLIRALKRGEIIALPCDRLTGDSARWVEFFGSPARLPDGPVRIALRTGAPLIPAFVLRRADNSFVIQVQPPLALKRTGDNEADVAGGMEGVVRAMEAHIARHPEQWLVAAPVWPMENAA